MTTPFRTRDDFSVQIAPNLADATMAVFVNLGKVNGTPTINDGRGLIETDNFDNALQDVRSALAAGRTVTVDLSLFQVAADAGQTEAKKNYRNATVCLLKMTDGAVVDTFRVIITSYNRTVSLDGVSSASLSMRVFEDLTPVPA